jgi:hypothetical protein
MNHEAASDTLTLSPGASLPSNAATCTAPPTRMAWSAGGWRRTCAESY